MHPSFSYVVSPRPTRKLLSNLISSLELPKFHVYVILTTMVLTAYKRRQWWRQWWSCLSLIGPAFVLLFVRADYKVINILYPVYKNDIVNRFKIWHYFWIHTVINVSLSNLHVCIKMSKTKASLNIKEREPSSPNANAVNVACMLQYIYECIVWISE